MGVDLIDHAAERRSHRATAVLVALAACLVVSASAPAIAEDETTHSSVYLVFDPETGDFVTVDDPNAALPNLTGLEPDGSSAPADQAIGDGFGMPRVVLMASLLAAALGGGIFFLRRRRGAPV